MSLSTSAPVSLGLMPSHLVTVRDHPGTHTVRTVTTDESGTSRTVWVDVHGTLLAVPESDVRPHAGVHNGSTHRVAVGLDGRTAASLNKRRDDSLQARYGKDRPAVTGITATEEPVKGFGFVETTLRVPPGSTGGRRLSADGLAVDVRVVCQPTLMSQPYDLIQIELEAPGLNEILLVATLADSNVLSFRVAYTLAQLGKLLGTTLPPSVEEQMTAIEQQLPQFGIKATFLTDKGQGNGDNHYSGGWEGKNGSGKMYLRVPDLKAFTAAEKFPIRSWKAADDLGPGRPVFDMNSTVLQQGVGKELGTNIEAEAEYSLPSKSEYARVLAQLDTLMASPDDWPALGILSMTGDKADVAFTDTYYDAVKGGQPTWHLLRKKIVLRRRSATKDVAGTFLVAVKGRRLLRGGPGLRGAPESLRLAAQVQMVEQAATPSAMTSFLCNTQADNPVGRFLADAVRDGKRPVVGEKSIWPEDPWQFAPVLEVVSMRRKFSLTLANSTSIDISIDSAVARTVKRTGAPVKESEPAYSLEFGVGHPALVLDPGGVPQGPDLTKPAGQAEPAARITRPYHVPADLSPEFFDKIDYGQFRVLTVALLERLFPGGAPLAPGGNKAHDLARSMKLF